MEHQARAPETAAAAVAAAATTRTPAQPASVPSLASVISTEQRLLDQLERLQLHLDSTRRAAPTAPGNATPTHTARGHRLRKQPAASHEFTKRIISVSMRLPGDSQETQSCADLSASGMPPHGVSVFERAASTPVISVGWTDNPSGPSFLDDWRRNPDLTDPDVERHVPVIIPDDLMRDYQNFCQETLWSLLHYDIDYVGVVGETQPALWEAYEQVNTKFAEVVTEIFEDGDLIWIHDYHLMLLPQMIRKRLWYARIGFFLYTPFPSAEIFRILPHRVDLLQGMLWADLVGFYTYDYSKQFLASCLRLLGLEGSPKGVELEPRGGHFCEIGIYPAGIDVDGVCDLIDSPPVKQRIRHLKACFAGRQVIVGVDRLDDCFAGITHKLLAFEDFLARNPEKRNKVVLVQVAIDPQTQEAKKVSSSNQNYNSLKKQVHEFVGRINSVNGSSASAPVHFVTRELPKEDLYGLMSIGDVCIVSSVRAGMNLIPYEWTVCQHRGQSFGPLILSEFAGSAQSFSTALHVNPWDTDQVSSSIETALGMDQDDRQGNDDIAYRFVSSHTSQLWGSNFIEDLETTEPNRTQPTPTPQLDIPLIINAYRISSTRKVIVLSYDGALVTFQTLVELMAPPDNVIATLKRLLGDPLSLIFLLTSRDRKTAAGWMENAGLGNRIGLACEHGSFLRWPGDDEWQALYADVIAGPPNSETWKSAVLPVMRHFTKRTPGAYLEEGEVTATWHYLDADQAFGAWQGRDLYRHLESFIVQHLQVEVISGDEKRRWIVVRPIGTGKQMVLNRILTRVAHDSDFILIAGEERHDDDMFDLVKDKQALAGRGFLGNAYTCHIGVDSTNAMFAVESAPRFCELLDEIAFEGVELVEVAMALNVREDTVDVPGST